MDDPTMEELLDGGTGLDEAREQYEAMQDDKHREFWLPCEHPAYAVFAIKGGYRCIACDTTFMCRHFRLDVRGAVIWCLDCEQEVGRK